MSNEMECHVELSERPSGPERIALVTGGNAGIGLATCRALAQLGITVLLGARDAERGAVAVGVLRADGLPVELCLIDVVDDGSVTLAASAIAARHGRLDILVNNAGFKEEFSPATPSETSLDLVRRTYETNVFGTIRVIQAMLPLLRRSSAGRIVNVSSGLGSIGRAVDPARPEHRVTLLGYCTSKTALNAVTVQFANELAPAAIKVNAVDPGPVATPMNPRAHRTPAQAVAPIVEMATIGSDGPTGGYFDEAGAVPW